MRDLSSSEPAAAAAAIHHMALCGDQWAGRADNAACSVALSPPRPLSLAVPSGFAYAVRPFVFFIERRPYRDIESLAELFAKN